jgi:hypothetical protein
MKIVLKRGKLKIERQQKHLNDLEIQILLQQAKINAVKSRGKRVS